MKPLAVPWLVVALALGGVMMGCSNSGDDDSSIDELVHLAAVIEIDSGATVTGSYEVTLVVTCTDGPTPETMRVWEGNDPGSTGWLPFSGITPFTLEQGEGTHRVSVQLGYGSVESPVAYDTIEVDTTPPAVAFLDLHEGQVVAPGGRIATLSVTDAHALDLVTLAVDGAEVSVGTDDAGTHSASLTLDEGEHTLTATARDEAGNEQEHTIHVTVDAEAPSITITSPTSGHETSSPSVTVEGSVDDPSVALVTVVVDEQPYEVPVDEGTFSYALDLDEGSHLIRAEAVDQAGNSGSSGDVLVTIDLTAPGVTLVSPEDDVELSTPELVVDGTVDDPGVTTVAVLLDDEEQAVADVLAGGSFSTSITLAEGTAVLKASAVDAVGNVGFSPSVVVSYVPPTSLPSVEIVSPLDNTITGLEELSVSGVVGGSASGEVALFVDGVLDSSCPIVDGEFVGSVALGPGVNNILAEARDADDNVGQSDPVHVHRDTEAPSDVAVYINSGVSAVSSLNVVLTFHAADLSQVEVRLSNSPDLADGTWELVSGSRPWTLIDGGTGTATVYAQFRDEWGNGPVDTSATVTLDTEAPTILQVTHDAASKTLGLGDTIHFTLHASEPGGTAWVDLGTVTTGIPLFDDGTHGDTTAGDAVFERDYAVLYDDHTEGSLVVGGYTDEAGNEASPLYADGLVVVVMEPMQFPVRVVLSEICTTNIDDYTYDDAYYFRDGIRAPSSGTVTTYSGDCESGFGPAEFWELEELTSSQLTVIVEGWDYDSIGSDDSLGSSVATISVTSPSYDFAAYTTSSASSGYFSFTYTKYVAPAIVSSTHPDPGTLYPSHDVEVKWYAPPVDVGVEGFSYVLDTSPDTIPPDEVTTTTGGATFEGLPSGVHYLHVKAKDSSGHFSSTATLQIGIQ